MRSMQPLKALVFLIALCGAASADMRDDLRAQLIEHEGVELEVYRDAGGWSIGVGHYLGDDPRPEITRERAMTWLTDDVQLVIDGLDAQLSWWRTLHPVRQQALANMAFAHGLPRLTQYTRMLSALRQHDYNAAAREALDSHWARDQAPGRAQEIAHMLRYAEVPE